MTLDVLKEIAGEAKTEQAIKLADDVLLASVDEDGISPAILCLVLYSVTYNLIAKAAVQGDDIFDTVGAMVTATITEAMLLAVTQGADEVEAMQSLFTLLKDKGIKLSTEK